MSHTNIANQNTAFTSKRSPYLLGAHFSIAAGLHQALNEARRYNCNVLQIFTKNSSSWKEKTLSPAEIDLFGETWRQTEVQVVAAHTSYLINLASPEKKKNAMSRHALKQELIRSSHLDLQFVVLHPGAHMGSGEQEGILRISSGINAILASIPNLKSRLLLETTAGQGSNVGYTFEQIAAILEKIENQAAIGVCYDTCHTFAAGYDIRDEPAYNRTIDRFQRIIGIENLYLIHLNDSKKEFASRVDRHEHIGEGYIGIKGFELIMNDARLEHIPKIIETPKGNPPEDPDELNLKKLRALIKSKG